MSTQWQIRQATIADAEGISKVQIGTWREAYRGIVADSILDSMDPEETAEMYRQRISSPMPYRKVAFIGNQIVGFSFFGWKSDITFKNDWFLYALYVLPEYQGLGIGRSLLMSAKETGIENSANRMVFGVLVGNDRSREFYDRSGAIHLEFGTFPIGGINYPTEYCYYDLQVTDSD